jgi:hypothetical protein
MAQAGVGPKKGVVVQFFMDAVRNDEKSAAEARPIFEDKEFIKKMIPGDATSNVVRPVCKADTIEFAREYQAFKAGLEAPVEGTPLTTIPFISKAQAMEMAAVGIKTAEQLRDLSDGNGQKFMGFFGLRSKVIAYLESAEKAAPVQQMQAELEKRDNDIAVLKRQLEEQSAQIKEITRARAK